jgi:hypothetical protein
LSHFLRHTSSAFGFEHADGETAKPGDVFRAMAGTDATGRSTAQEADSIGPVPFGGFPQEIAQGPYEATRIRWRYGLFVNKNHSAVLSLFFRPGFEQRGNRPSIVDNKRQPLHGCLLQAGRVLLS